MSDTTIIENIINPEDALKEYKKYLLSIYATDYQEKNINLINKRLNNAIYIFESTPIENMAFLEENSSKINSKKIYTYCIEYQDYIKKLKELEKLVKDKYYSILSSAFGVYQIIDKDKFLNLDIESFQTKSINLLKSDTTSESIKRSILLRQENYKNECLKLGIPVITNSTCIDKIIRQKRLLISIKNKSLIKNTRWGKRIQKDIYKKYKVKLPVDVLSNILFNESPTTTLINYSNSYLTVCNIPLIRLMHLKALDNIFFHETRHVIEIDKLCGIEGENNNYRLLNEIRTQKNADSDSQILKSMPLFSNCEYEIDNPCKYISLYPYTFDFFEENHSLLNEIAIKNDYKRLEETFDKDNLISFEKYLEIIYNNTNDQETSHIDSIIKSLVKKLNNSK